MRFCVKEKRCAKAHPTRAQLLRASMQRFCRVGLGPPLFTFASKKNGAPRRTLRGRSPRRLDAALLQGGPRPTALSIHARKEKNGAPRRTLRGRSFCAPRCSAFVGWASAHRYSLLRQRKTVRQGAPFAGAASAPPRCSAFAGWASARALSFTSEKKKTVRQGAPYAGAAFAPPRCSAFAGWASAHPLSFTPEKKKRCAKAHPTRAQLPRHRAAAGPANDRHSA